MLDATMTEQLRAYMQNIRVPIELVASLDDSPKAGELKSLLDEIAVLSDKVSVRHDGHALLKPSFQITCAGENTGVEFAGIPLGHEFTSLVLALLHVGGHPPKEEADLLEAAKTLGGPLHFETFYSLSCQNCPDVVQALNMLAALNPKVRHVAIDGALFQDVVTTRKVMAVPTIFLNGQPFGQGRMDLASIIHKLDDGADAKAAEKINAKDPFDVLIVGGGPAGAAAAIYAARKGIRTGIVTERFGGQVLDTTDIENFISVSHTEGPKMAAALDNHVRDYDVDVMNLQTAAKLVPATEQGGYHSVELANGASLKAKTIILTTGARWRQMNVPGEDEYRTRGVTYCPHCDGPLFKGKSTAVIGGGNSGAEAAIDLAGVTDHVTLIEFMDELRADKVLQDKMASLPNVTVIKGAETTEVTGDGEKVAQLTYKDRKSGDMHHVNVAGIFVQIGLIPNTEWLKDSAQNSSVPLSPRGEIEIDAACRTAIPGIFAAGDVTTTPYKQIVIAMGEGSKAALSAFDYLIRN